MLTTGKGATQSVLYVRGVGRGIGRERLISIAPVWVNIVIGYHHLIRQTNCKQILTRNFNFSNIKMFLT